MQVVRIQMFDADRCKNKNDRCIQQIDVYNIQLIDVLKKQYTMCGI